MAKGVLGSKEVRWKWAVGNGVGAQGEGHDGMRGEGAWLRNMEGCRDANGKWVDGRDLAKGILWSKEVRWKWAVWNGVGAQGEGHDGVRGGCRATQSRVKSGVHGAGCSSGGMQSGVPGGRQGEGQSERRSAARGGAQGEMRGAAQAGC